MSFSMNEVQAMARKAARGAGLDWGVAEEAGWATRWLCGVGLPGVEILSSVLACEDGVQSGLKSPELPWQGQGTRVSPVHAGVALSDTARHLPTQAVAVLQVLEPLMLLPFAWAASVQLQRPLSVGWGRGNAVVTPLGLNWTGERVAAADVEIACLNSTAAKLTLVHSHSRAVPDPAHWTAIARLAHRTYCPATDESRLLGAGGEVAGRD